MNCQGSSVGVCPDRAHQSKRSLDLRFDGGWSEEGAVFSRTRSPSLAVTAFAANVHLNPGGGAFMQKSIFAGLLLVSLLITSGGGAQTPSVGEKPVWTMESIKVKPGMFDFTLGYLDDHWMHVREEAKRQGLVLSYHRIVEQDSRERERAIGEQKRCH